jgi:hypothetical protein
VREEREREREREAMCCFCAVFYLTAQGIFWHNEWSGIEQSQGKE